MNIECKANVTGNRRALLSIQYEVHGGYKRGTLHEPPEYPEIDVRRILQLGWLDSATDEAIERLAAPVEIKHEDITDWDRLEQACLDAFDDERSQAMRELDSED